MTKEIEDLLDVGTARRPAGVTRRLSVKGLLVSRFFRDFLL
jgi:hypothetical protein